METADFAGVGSVRRGYEFDVERLAGWCAQNVAGFSGPMTVVQFRGGQSNPTYKLTTPNAVYVLRRKPPGKLLQGAHATEREARVLQALAGRFPVPAIYAVSEDETVIGTAFYLMAYVEGRIFWDATLPEIAMADRPQYFDTMNETIAKLHGFDPVLLGLATFGRADNYVRRQIERWSRQYQEDTDAGRDPYLDRLIDWLPRNIPPAGRTGIVHGDFRIDNLVFHRAEPRICAVLDWELATIGDPLVDFAYHAMMYRMPQMTLAGLRGKDLAALNIPAERDYVARYCQRTGRARIDHLDFYMAFNLFRLAAIFHGIRGRMVRGTAVSERAGALASAVPVIAQLAWDQAVKAL
jgi:aminoglycoside phosphotransferase (APT) family kinase protein